MARTPSFTSAAFACCTRAEETNTRAVAASIERRNAFIFRICILSKTVGVQKCKMGILQAGSQAHRFCCLVPTALTGRKGNR
jgi:hypothetical protein